jgi:hypothetical protein
MMERIEARPGCGPPTITLPDVMDAIGRTPARDLFPRSQNAYRNAIRHDFDRLEADGEVYTATVGSPGRRVRMVAFLQCGRSAGHDPRKSLISQELAAQKVAQHPMDGRQGEDKDERGGERAATEAQLSGDAGHDQDGPARGSAAHLEAVAHGGNHEVREPPAAAPPPEMHPPVAPHLELVNTTNINHATDEGVRPMSKTMTTDDDQLEIDYLYHRLAVLQAKHGLPPQPQVGPLGENVVRFPDRHDEMTRFVADLARAKAALDEIERRRK